VRGRVVVAVRRPALAFAVGLLVTGCLGRVQGFADWTSDWRTELDDRTGAVSSIAVLDGAGPVDDLSSDTVRLRNVGPTVIEVAWMGGACLDCARFSLAPGRGSDLDLRYDLGPPCEEPVAIGYAFEIRFVHAIDAGSIVVTPNWGP